MLRITLVEALSRITASVLGLSHSIPKTTNKGNVGQWLETAIGIPTSSACLDCLDGEIKAFPLKRTAKGLQSKETIAITMVEPTVLLTQPFEEARVYKKLENTLFVPYLRDGDNVTFYKPFLFTKEHPLMVELKADYELIQVRAAEGVMTGSIGTYLQTRTKGAGHGSTSRAFYLRPQFADRLILPTI
jgi:DNA mismatch repair protein MutH